MEERPLHPDSQTPVPSAVDDALRVLFAPYSPLKDGHAEMEKSRALEVLSAEGTAIDALIWATRHPCSSVRADAAYALGRLADRRAFPHLLRLLRDSARWPVRKALWAIRHMRESRATFAIINLYENSAPHFRGEALQTLGELGDPRSKDFLERVATSEEPHLRDCAVRALTTIARGEPFPYRYVGPPEAIRPRGMRDASLLLRQQADQQTLPRWLEEYRCDGVVGYVVALDGTLALWPDWGDEAQAVGGEDVLAAGSLRLTKQSSWCATEITNISFGYYPDVSSFPWVRRAAERVGIEVRQAEFSPRLPHDLTQYSCGFCDEPFLKNQPFYGQAAGDSLIGFTDPGGFGF